MTSRVVVDTKLVEKSVPPETPQNTLVAPASKDPNGNTAPFLAIWLEKRKLVGKP